MPVWTGVLLKMNPRQGSKTAFCWKKGLLSSSTFIYFFLSSRSRISDAAVNITILPCGYYIKASVHPAQTPTLSHSLLLFPKDEGVTFTGLCSQGVPPTKPSSRKSRVIATTLPRGQESAANICAERLRKRMHPHVPQTLVPPHF